jgi:hypothetical protein
VNGPSHYVKGEELAEHAEDLIKQGDPDGLAPVWAALARVHATLAEAAPAALGTSHLDALKWADVARTRHGDLSPEPRHMPLAVPKPDRPGRTATWKPGNPPPPLSTTVNDALLGSAPCRDPAPPTTLARVGKGQAATAGPIPHPSCQTCAFVTHGASSTVVLHALSALPPECADTNRLITYSDGSAWWHRNERHER